MQLTHESGDLKYRIKALESLDAFNNPLWRRNILIIAAVGFVVGIVLSLRAQPDILSNLKWMPLVLLALVCIPVTLLLNTLEFGMSARLIGHKFPFWKSAETTIIGSVANMLPIPGGTIVRVAALKAAGASFKRGTSVTLLVALIWIGVAFSYAGVWLLVLRGAAQIEGLGLIFLLIGIAALGASVFWCVKLQKDWWQTTILVLIKVGLVLIDTTRILLCLWAFGFDAGFGQASVLAASSVLGAAVSIVPAGLGVREGVASLLGPVVGVAASSAYLSASLNRIIGLAVMAPAAIVLVIRQKAGKTLAKKS